MNTTDLFDPDRRSKAPFVFIVCLVVLLGAAFLASQTQKGFGQIDVSNVTYINYNGIVIRAKLLRPQSAAPSNPVPGIVYVHGYQNNRETSDAYCIELARRGIVVLEIDAIGRGNSGIPGKLDDPDFDPTWGGRTSLSYLKQLSFVDNQKIGLMGHSLGAEYIYPIALKDPTVNALVISGYAYGDDATIRMPRNMLMIFGKYDEFRERMTGTRNFEKEWMTTDRTRKVFPVKSPEFGKTYGEFDNGTARRVFKPSITHLHTSHSSAAIAEALEWIKAALNPPPDKWIASDQQIWPVKEWSTLVAMLACMASLLPLGLMLLRSSFFHSLHNTIPTGYSCSGKDYLKPALINAVLMWLYFPLVFGLWGIHLFVIPIDTLFPQMITNGIVWWFFWINLFGFLLFSRWFKRQRRKSGLTLFELGLSDQKDRYAVNGKNLIKSVLMALILFLFAYLIEHTIESILIVDFRFIFPFASDLTAYRTLLWFTYFPLLLMGFLLMGVFLHGQMRRPMQTNWLKTFMSWSAANILLLILPLAVIVIVQFGPLLAGGVIPIRGPAGFFIALTQNLLHMMVVLIMVIPIQTWFYQLTGRIYLGAVLNAALVTWMFVSSQVIAPVPVQI